MFEVYDSSNQTFRIFDIGYLKFVYPGIDLSYNLYKNICDKIQENRKCLASFKNGYFSDHETKLTLVYGTEYLISYLDKFKRFLENKNEIK